MIMRADLHVDLRNATGRDPPLDSHLFSRLQSKLDRLPAQINARFRFFMHARRAIRVHTRDREPRLACKVRAKKRSRRMWGDRRWPIDRK